MSNGVRNQINGARGFELTPGGYLTIGVIIGFVGMVVGAGGEHAGVGLAIFLVGVVPFLIGLIGLGVKVGRQD